MLTNLTNWLLFCFFVVGSLGGITYFVRLMFYKEARTEVRYMQIPVYYGYEQAWAQVEKEMRHFGSAAGRAGDMAHYSPDETDKPKESA